MVMSNALLRVFWPSDIPRSSSPGVVVGWRNSELDVFVLSIFEDVECRSVENSLRVGTLYRNSPHPIARIFHLCGRPSMQVLGTTNPREPPATFDAYHLCIYTHVSAKFPQVFRPPDCAVSVQIITFDRPHPTRMQYISLSPISLILGDKATKDTMGLDNIDAEEELEKARLAKLAEKLRLHTVMKHPHSLKELALSSIINQVNCSFEMAKLLQENMSLIGTRSKRSLSVSERVVESATTLWEVFMMATWHLITLWIYPILSRAFVIGLVCHRIIAEMLLRVLEWRFRPEGAALKDISATAQQVDIRLQQFCYWPIQYLTLRRRKDDWESVTKSHPDYIRFYNSLWLVANDVIIGIALGSYIIDNAPWVAYQINSILSGWTVEGLQRMISWLMDWPAGLKLNNELAAFLGDLFLWVIEYWAECIANLQPYLPQIIYFIGFSSFAGASMPISLFSDLLSILTLHIYSFYVASAKIFNWQLTIIISLFHLFRGKKRNVLRNRIDSCDYDLDQLLLGTILFTLLFFLLPTVVVFYLTFASARMAIIILKAALDTQLAFLNHFPLFALMLRVKDSRRLPGGIHFELRAPSSNLSQHSSFQSPQSPSSPSPQPSPPLLPPPQSQPTPPPSPPPSSISPTTPTTTTTETAAAAAAAPSSPSPPHSTTTSYVHLHSVPLSLRAMFTTYFQLGYRIRKHYLSPSVILALATGRFVPPIHRRNLYSLQYSMLPARRAGIREVWARLTEVRKQKQFQFQHQYHHSHGHGPGYGHGGNVNNGSIWKGAGAGGGGRRRI